MISRANCSQTEYAVVSNCGKNSVWVDNSLFQNWDSSLPRLESLPYVNKFLHHRLLNPTPVGSNCTVYKSASSQYEIIPAHSDHSNKIMQQTERMDKCGAYQFVSRHSQAVKRLDDIMAARGKLVQYTMLSMAGLMPCRIYTYNAKCGDMATYGCGSSIEEAIGDAATKFLEKFEFASVQVDDNLHNSMHSSRLESKVNVKSNNYISTLQEYCQAHGLDLPKYEHHLDNDIKNRYMYSVICSIGQFKCTGVGISKKIAKNHAARLMYNQINSNNPTNNQSSTSNTSMKKPIDFGQGLSKNEAKNDSVNNALDQIYHGKNKPTISVNYIGILQEKCTALGWELPKYEYQQENVNEIHKLFYSVICSAGPHKSTGVGKSKQLAKNQAAQFLCDQINLDQQKISELHSNQALDKVEKSPCDSNYSMKLWCKQLSSSKKECVKQLNICISCEEIDMTPFEFLTKLANEENFSVTYERLSDHINGKQVYGAIYVHVAKKYVIMFIGDGITDAKARNLAAKNTLAFIKHITLKI